MIDWIIKPFVILAASGLIHLAARRAATRHFAWTLAFAGLLILPFTPEIAGFREAPVQVPVPVLVHTIDHALSPAVEKPLSKTSERPNTGTSRVRKGVLTVWLVGFLTVLARLIPGFWKVRRITRHAARIGNCGRAEILEHPSVTTPFTWGILRPVILLPAGQEWPEDRRNHVISHEYAHVQRADWLTQSLAQLACAVYWFHPLVWLASFWMRRASEQACDDAVVNGGHSPEGYAEHLLELAQSGEDSALASTPVVVAMWNRSQLEERIMRILEQHDRRGLGKLAAAVMTGLALLAIVPVASMRIQAQSKDSVTLRGVVNDPSGARVPNAKLSFVAKPSGPGEQPGRPSFVTQTGEDGSYSVELPPGIWITTVEKPGFGMMARAVSAELKNPEMTRDYTLSMGQISESLGVAGTRPANRPVVAKPPTRIRVGGNVQAANLIRKTNPEYPKELQDQGIEGTVELEAIISKEGNVINVHPRSKTVNENLILSASNAVRTWQYRPTLLNGEPVEIVTTVTVRFYLQ